MDLTRAVVYCRCSTEEESQMDALYNQVAECEACVRERGWQLVESYVESKSGTSTKGRAQYNRLFEDLLLDRFEVIVIKSQDRLMRNVKDWYLFLDRMLNHKKSLYMYLERKYYSPDDALITGIKAILAEEYSRELSKKINNAHRNRQKNGGKPVLTSRVFGFKKMQDGSVGVVAEEEGIIKLIYQYCAAGYGCRVIANHISGSGYKKKTGTPITPGFIGKMIPNPLYKGIMVMNRLHYDFETKKTVKVPENQWIVCKDRVPAIVSEELWDQANRAMGERARIYGGGKHQKAAGTGKYDLSGKIICGFCGQPYYRTVRKRSCETNPDIAEWKCSRYLEQGRREGKIGEETWKSSLFPGGCDSIHINEKILYAMLKQEWIKEDSPGSREQEMIIRNTEEILQKILNNSSCSLKFQETRESEDKLLAQKERLLTKLLDGVISDSDYEKRNRSLEEKLALIKRIQIEENDPQQKITDSISKNQRIENIKSRLRGGGIEQAILAWMIQDISSITVYEWQVEVGFKNSETEKVILNYPFPPNTARGRSLDKKEIVKRMGENPKITARDLGAALDRPVKQIQNRIKELREEGRIRYKGGGGHGSWQVLDSDGDLGKPITYKE